MPQAPLGAVLPGLRARQDVDRQVPRLRMALQVVEHCVAVQLRQVAAHDHRVRHELVDEREAGVAAQRQQAPEPVVVRHVHRPARQRTVPGHHERDPLAGRQLAAVVGERVGQRGAVDAPARPRGCQLCRDGLVEHRRRGHRHRAGRRQVERERGALTLRALHVDLAAEQAGDLAADREPEPGPAEAAADRALGLLERLEDQAQLVRRDADPGVDHRERDDVLGARQRVAAVVHVGRRSADAELDGAAVRELERVREQVLQHLLEALLVGRELLRGVRRQVDREVESLLARHRREGALDVLADRAQLRAAGVHVHLPRLDLGEVEDVVDQREQVRAGVVDRGRRVDLLGREVPALVRRQHLGQDQQRVQRRAQLVRHVREELGLVLRAERELLGLLLERRAGHLDLAVLDLDVAVLALELLGLLLQLVVGRLQLHLLALERLRLLL